MTILCVDDEESILDTLDMILEAQGFSTVRAETGRQGFEQFGRHAPDLLIVDRMLPDGDGLDLCRQVRRSSTIPILMLTARGDLDDRVDGLNAGADDYLPKPFKVKELVARVHALLRRSAASRGPAPLEFGALRLDPSRRSVSYDGTPVELTALEFGLLSALVAAPGQVFSREQLLDQVWGWDWVGNRGVVDVHLSSLRAKLGDHDKTLIRTIRGLGFTLGR